MSELRFRAKRQIAEDERHHRPRQHRTAPVWGVLIERPKPYEIRHIFVSVEAEPPLVVSCLLVSSSFCPSSALRMVQLPAVLLRFLSSYILICPSYEQFAPLRVGLQ